MISVSIIASFFLTTAATTASPKSLCGDAKTADSSMDSISSIIVSTSLGSVSYTHLRAHET